MTKIKWTAEVWARVDQMTAAGMTRAQIAEALDCGTSAVNTAIERRDLRTGRDDLWSAEKITRLRELWADGHLIAEIGRRMGMSKNAVGSKAHRLGLPVREVPISTAASKLAEPRPSRFVPWDVTAREKRARSAEVRAKRPRHWAQLVGRSVEPLPAGHPVTWNVLQSLLSPEHREAWPERPAGDVLAVSCLSGVSRYAEKPKAHQRPKNPGLLETWAMLGEGRAAA